MDISKELGLRIRYYRKEKHLTQENLAEICGLHPTYIGQLERGEKNATVESVYRIAKGLNIPFSKLFENMEHLERGDDNIPLDIYHSLLLIPQDKQAIVQNIMTEIITLLKSD